MSYEIFERILKLIRNSIFKIWCVKNFFRSVLIDRSKFEFVRIKWIFYMFLFFSCRTYRTYVWKFFLKSLFVFLEIIAGGEKIREESKDNMKSWKGSRSDSDGIAGCPKLLTSSSGRWLTVVAFLGLLLRNCTTYVYSWLSLLRRPSFFFFLGVSNRSWIKREVRHIASHRAKFQRSSIIVNLLFQSCFIFFLLSWIVFLLNVTRFPSNIDISSS